MYYAAGWPCDPIKVRRGNDDCRGRREVETHDPLCLALWSAPVWRTHAADPWGHPADAHPATARIRSGWGDRSGSLQTSSSQGGVFADSCRPDTRATLDGDGTVGRALRTQERKGREACLLREPLRAVTHQETGEKASFLLLLLPQGRDLSDPLPEKARALNELVKHLRLNVRLVAQSVGSSHGMRNEMCIVFCDRD